MAENTYSFLKESGFEPASELLVRKIIATTEHGRRYHLNIFENKKSSLFQVDGYIVTVGKKCDKLVLVEKEVEDWAEIFVELKGVDVAGAIKQLKASLENPNSRCLTTCSTWSRNQITGGRTLIHAKA